MDTSGEITGGQCMWSFDDGWHDEDDRCLLILVVVSLYCCISFHSMYCTLALELAHVVPFVVFGFSCDVTKTIMYEMYFMLFA
jgi:hypothetical protein